MCVNVHDTNKNGICICVTSTKVKNLCHRCDHNNPPMAQEGLCYIPPQMFHSAELTSFFTRFNIMSGRNTRLRLLDNVSDANVLDSGIRIVSDGMSWMPMSWMQMDRPQETLLAIANYVLLKHCIDSICVCELMRCFRNVQCCVFRESTAPKVLCRIPWLFMYDCLIVM